MPRALLLRAILLVLLSGLALGCGEAPGPPDRDEGVGARLDGLRVHLSRHSTECDRAAAAELVAEVDGDMEFPSEALKSLGPPCSATIQPAVEVYLADESLLLDFRQTENPGAFPEAAFDGYRLAFDRSCGDPVIAVATIDRDSSSIELGSHRIQSDFDRIEINLSGVAYDPRSLLKIDLDVVSVRCTNH